MSAAAVPGSMIRVRGARVHNLRDLDVDIPRDKLVAITGVSGSGKSTLAKDVLFAEGQRRYLQGLAPGHRGRLDGWERADVDSVEGIPAAICIDQRFGVSSVRSTLGTMTEINSYLRLLFARVGTVHCPHCGRPLSRQTPQAIVDRVLGLGQQRRVMLMAPVVHRRRGGHGAVFERLVREGFVRARVDGELVELADPPSLEPRRRHTIDVVVDRVVVREGLEGRLQESVELALRAGRGRVLVAAQVEDGWDETLYSSTLACPDCQWSVPEVQPRTFSFNSPQGACPSCRGLGRVDGEADESPPADQVCPACDGTRLGPLPRAVTVDDLSITDVWALAVSEAHRCLGDWLEGAGTGTGAGEEAGPKAAVLRHLLPHIVERLAFLERVGLDYLTLDRPTSSLSGGEHQRARLAGALGSGLVGVGYVLDEPTIGLHAADTRRLVECLEDLRDRGNSVLVVEHDLGLLRRADWVIDLGPGGGREGGRLVVAGTAEEVAACEASLTGAHLAGRVSLPGREARDAVNQPAVEIRGATLHNLDNLDVRFPLGVLCAVTGVSGAGKTSLVSASLVPALRHALDRTARSSSPPGVTLNWDPQPTLDRVVEVAATAAGRSQRSTPATLTGIWDEIRKVFARTRSARTRGFSPRRFSFNTPAGRCAACRGRGEVVIEMQFLPDLAVTCNDCGGGRFNPATLRVRYRGRSVGDVLAMSAAEAVEFFENHPRVVTRLQMLVDVGLGYLVLGQSTPTLSGGELQRVRLAGELGRSRSANGLGKTLYVLDEPTIGLHAHDVGRLLDVLNRLVDEGNSVIVVEHHPGLIAAADWVIDLGPGGGANGGRIIAEGTPQQLAESSRGATAAVLRG